MIRVLKVFISFPFRPLVLSVLFSIGSYPLVTTLFERWYSDGFFLAAAFDTFRVYEKSFNKECIVSSFLLQVFIVVLSLLPDYLYVILKYIKTSFSILQYHYNMLYKNAANEEVQKGTSSGSSCIQSTDETVRCFNVSNIFKKRQNFDVVERGGSKHKSHRKSSVMPIDKNIDTLNTKKEQSKTPYLNPKFNKPLEPLNAQLLQSNLTLDSSISEINPDVRNSSELPSHEDIESDINGASNTHHLETGKDTGLSKSIANILFKPEPNKNQMKQNLNPIEGNSLSVMVSYHNGSGELPIHDGHDNPSFEKTTPLREVEECQSIDNRFTTKF